MSDPSGSSAGPAGLSGFSGPAGSAGSPPASALATSSDPYASVEDDRVFLKVQINAIDVYEASPTPLDIQRSPGASGNSRFSHVPVIRVFGTTDSGFTIVAHIHGVLPYLFVDYHGDTRPSAFSRNCARLKAAINEQMALSYQSGGQSGVNSGLNSGSNCGSTRRLFCAHISVAQAIPFYGYSATPSLYYKIYMLSPSHMSRLRSILQSGKVLRHIWQPLEGHIPMRLQFCADYNLFGCGWLSLSRALFRQSVIGSLYGGADADDAFLDYVYGCSRPRAEALEQWCEAAIPDEDILPKRRFPRIGSCALEVDVLPQWILNRETVAQEVNQVGVQTEAQAEAQPGNRRWLNSTRGLWRDIQAERRARGMPQYKPPKPRDGTEADKAARVNIRWQAAEQLEAQFRARVASSAPGVWPPSPPPWAAHVPTVAQLVTELQPSAAPLWRLHAETVAERLQTDGEEEEFAFNVIPSSQAEVEAEIVAEAVAESVTETVAEINELPDSDFSGLSELEAELSDAENDFAADIGTDTDASDGSAPGGAADNRRTKRRRTGQSGSESGGSASDSDSEPINRENPHIAARATRKLTDFTAAPQKGNAEPSAAHISSFDFSSLSQYLGSSSPPGPAPLLSVYGSTEGRRLFRLASGVPPRSRIDELLALSHQLRHIYPDPFYSDPQDAARAPRPVYAGELHVVGTKDDRKLPQFEFTAPLLKSVKPPSGSGIGPVSYATGQKWLFPSSAGFSRKFRYLAAPPSRATVTKAAEHLKSATFPSFNLPATFSSQIEAANPRYKTAAPPFSQPQPPARKPQFNPLTLLAVEILTDCRPGRRPDPRHDAVLGIFWRFQPQDAFEPHDAENSGALLLSGPPAARCRGISGRVEVAQSEVALLLRLALLVKLLDPDILAGYEVHTASWGYLLQRYAWLSRKNMKKTGTNNDCATTPELSGLLSRIDSSRIAGTAPHSRWGYQHGSAFDIVGRHILNVWRLLRHELPLPKYTLETAALRVLRRRLPLLSPSELAEMWRQPGDGPLAVAGLLADRTAVALHLLDATALVAKTAEQARVVGIDFASVLSRGSQYKVESLLLRLTKQEGFLLLSPSRQQVAQQAPLQCLPLILEPRSGLYTAPLVVLDFQSLYPSVMVAYNYCYSTLVGKVDSVASRGAQNKVGVAQLDPKPGEIAALAPHLTVAPNGLMFVSPEVRPAVLGRMLTDLLETRVMVKQAMAELESAGGAAGFGAAKRRLNARQLALKLIANVTYGYTSATFSGRMPCAELADAVVQTGRETLESAARLITENRDWGAEVVYGDTDSLFVLLPGKSRAEAFRIGREMAKAVTAANPAPIRLKMEKVYHPALLLAKKRYVGCSYEAEAQQEYKFDAKGIETVRRDGTSALQRVEEAALRVLFETRDVSLVKSYVVAQWKKLLAGKISVQDFCFAREVRLGSYKNESSKPAGAVVAQKLKKADSRAEPQFRERVPYVVVRGAANERLRDRCVPPEVLLGSGHLQLDAEWYIEKHLLPPLERIFNVVGVNVRVWYFDMPKVKSGKSGKSGVGSGGGASTKMKAFRAQTNHLIDSFSRSGKCRLCHRHLAEPLEFPNGVNGGFEQEKPEILREICNFCLSDRQTLIGQLTARIAKDEIQFSQLLAICRMCVTEAVSSGAGVVLTDPTNLAVRCENCDCSIYYSRLKAERKLGERRGFEAKVIEELSDW